MSHADAGIALTPGELVAFTQKLEAWAGGLSARERSFLEQLLADAHDAAAEDASGFAALEGAFAGADFDDDVQGFAMPASSPFGSLLSGYSEGLAAAEAEQRVMEGLAV